MDLIFPTPRNNPEYQFYQVMSGYNYNFSSITQTISLITSGTQSNYFSAVTADTLYLTAIQEPLTDNTVDIGTSFNRFRNLNFVNGISVGFTSSTMYSDQISANTIYLCGVSIDEKFLSIYDVLSGGDW